MKTRIIKFAFLAALMLTAVIKINAQVDQPVLSDPDMKPEMPAPEKRAVMPASKPAEVMNLMKFNGNWEADVTMSMQGKSYRGVYTWQSKETAEGNGLIGEEGFSNPDIGTMKGTDLAGFDPTTAKIRWFTVDNMGTAHEHSGEWITPDHLFLEHESTREGKRYVEKIDFVFKGDDTLDFKLVGTLDGNEIESGEGVFHKK